MKACKNKMWKPIKEMFNDSFGFSVVELLIAMIIILLLAVTITPMVLRVSLMKK